MDSIDPSLISSVLATIDARGYGNYRTLPSISNVTAAVSQAMQAHLPGSFYCEPSFVVTGGTTIAADKVTAPSSITALSAAMSARKALSVLKEVSSPVVRLSSIGKRSRTVPSLVPLLPASDGALRKKVRGRRPNTEVPDSPSEGDSAGATKVKVRALRDRSVLRPADSEFSEVEPEFEGEGSTRQSDECSGLGGGGTIESARDIDVDWEATDAAPKVKSRGAAHLPQHVTDQLIAWVIAHKRHPYPTNGMGKVHIFGG